MQEAWGNYFSQVVPYLQAIFLPLDGILSETDGGSSSGKDNAFSVQKICFMAFRDKVLLSSVLTSHLEEFVAGQTQFPPRVRQMVELLRRLDLNDENEEILDDFFGEYLENQIPQAWRTKGFGKSKKK
eukprot:TRINITY_DN2381_c0_g1_i1.p2 TRINITY_DN2381_c0_g1~~TRINITY_DN2381_c0_g1_i1.p2  ORF type:complete len:128 (-),score=37.62 TRINITY_DN2381_c0_g1_i1:406-789(-)